MDKKAIKLVKDNYEIHVKFSNEAIDKKLVKFIVTGDNKEIILSADEIISILVNQVNSETLSASFVESERINVVEVGRQIRCVLDKDFKKGDVININYTHPYPLEFALIEEMWKIATLKKELGVTVLTDEYISSIKSRIKPEMVEYMSKFYKSFKNIKTNNKMEEINKDEVVENNSDPIDTVEEEKESEEDVESESEADVSEESSEGVI